MLDWKEKNPSYRHKIFSEKSAAQYLTSKNLVDSLRAFRLSKHPAQKADIFRLAFLFLEGGIYIDADDACGGDLNNVIPEDARFIGYQEFFGSVGNNFLVAEPGNEIIGQALEGATATILSGAAESTWLSTGPGLLSRAFASIAFERRSMHLRPGYYLTERWELLPIVLMHRNVDYRSSAKNWIWHQEQRTV